MSDSESLPLHGDHLVLYDHVQRTHVPLLLAALLAPALLLVAALYLPHVPAVARGAAGAAAALAFLAALDCAALRVRVTPRALRAAFALGWPARTVARASVVGVVLARPPALYGWGYRWLGPGRVMFRVCGLEAVRVALEDGSVFFVGTDDPAGLKEALETE